MWGKELVRCPVCQMILGKRTINEFFVVHCEECQTVFTYKPNERKPRAVLDRDERKKCHCDNCEARK